MNVIWDILVFLFSWKMFDFFTKTRMNHLINKTCFRLWSFKNKWTHGKYILKIHVEKYNAWYMKSIWKLQCEFADGKVNSFTGQPGSSTCMHFWNFTTSYRRNAAYVFFIIFLFISVIFHYRFIGGPLGAKTWLSCFLIKT